MRDDKKNEYECILKLHARIQTANGTALLRLEYIVFQFQVYMLELFVIVCAMHGCSMSMSDGQWACGSA